MTVRSGTLQAQDVEHARKILPKLCCCRCNYCSGVNQGGTLQAGQLGLQAGGHIRNESLTVTQGFAQNDGRVNATGSHTSLSNIGRIEAGDRLQIQAGGDFVDQAGRIRSGGTASIKADGNVRFGTVETGSSYQANIGSSNLRRESTQAQVGTLSTGSDLSVSGGKDVAFTGTQVDAGGNASFSAGRNLRFEAATSSSASDQRNDPSGSKFRQIDRWRRSNCPNDSRHSSARDAGR